MEWLYGGRWLLWSILWVSHSVATNSANRKIYLKLVNEKRFLGHPGGSLDLKLVSPKYATKFFIEDTDNLNEKKLVTSDRQYAVSREGYFFTRRWFELKPLEDDSSSQNINLVYSGPGAFVLMQDAWCLSEVYGVFRRVSCNAPQINQFNICTSRRCRRHSGSYLHRDIMSIKALLMDSGLNMRRKPMHSRPPPERRPRQRRPDQGAQPNDSGDEYDDMGSSGDGDLSYEGEEGDGEGPGGDPSGRGWSPEDSVELGPGDCVTVCKGDRGSEDYSDDSG